MWFSITFEVVFDFINKCVSVAVSCLLMSVCNSSFVTQLTFCVIVDCSIVNKRQSVVEPDELQVKIADLGNACWTVSY